LAEASPIGDVINGSVVRSRSWQEGVLVQVFADAELNAPLV
jgi:hypothetical protein